MAMFHLLKNRTSIDIYSKMKSVKLLLALSIFLKFGVILFTNKIMVSFFQLKL